MQDIYLVVLEKKGWTQKSYFGTKEAACDFLKTVEGKGTIQRLSLYETANECVMDSENNFLFKSAKTEAAENDTNYVYIGLSDDGLVDIRAPEGRGGEDDLEMKQWIEKTKKTEVGLAYSASQMIRKDFTRGIRIREWGGNIWLCVLWKGEIYGTEVDHSESPSLVLFSANGEALLVDNLESRLEIICETLGIVYEKCDEREADAKRCMWCGLSSDNSLLHDHKNIAYTLVRWLDNMSKTNPVLEPKRGLIAQALEEVEEDEKWFNEMNEMFSLGIGNMGGQDVWPLTPM